MLADCGPEKSVPGGPEWQSDQQHAPCSYRDLGLLDSKENCDKACKHAGGEVCGYGLVAGRNCFVHIVGEIGVCLPLTSDSIELWITCTPGNLLLSRLEFQSGACLTFSPFLLNFCWCTMFLVVFQVQAPHSNGTISLSGQISRCVLGGPYTML